MSFERDRKSTSSQEDSGLIDLHALVASAPPAASEFRDEPRSGTLPTLAAFDAEGKAPPSSARFEKSGVQSIVIPDSLSPASAASTPPPRSGPSPLVAVFVLGVGVASLAGALFLVFTHRAPTLTPSAAAAVMPHTAPEVAFLAPPSAPLAKEAEPTAAKAHEGKAVDELDEPATAAPVAEAPVAAPVKPVAQPVAHVAALRAPLARAPIAAAPVAAPVAPPAPAAAPAKPAAAQTKPDALSAAIESSVAAPASKGAAVTEEKARPASYSNGNLPARPAQGAVTTALGGALPKARACLGPDAAVSRAMVSFGPSGSVSDVNVTGSAEGKPEGACIKNALEKAHVPPFSGDVYKAQVTVRPL